MLLDHFTKETHTMEKKKRTLSASQSLSVFMWRHVVFLEIPISPQ